MYCICVDWLLAELCNACWPFVECAHRCRDFFANNPETFGYCKEEPCDDHSSLLSLTVRGLEVLGKVFELATDGFEIWLIEYPTLWNGCALHFSLYAEFEDNILSRVWENIKYTSTILWVLWLCTVCSVNMYKILTSLKTTWNGWLMESSLHSWLHGICNTGLLMMYFLLGEQHGMLPYLHWWCATRFFGIHIMVMESAGKVLNFSIS